MIIRKVVGKIMGQPADKKPEKDKKPAPVQNDKPQKVEPKVEGIPQPEKVTTTTETPTAPLVDTDAQTSSRFRTHLQTDKSIYKPKETVYLRGFVVNPFVSDVPDPSETTSSSVPPPPPPPQNTPYPPSSLQPEAKLEIISPKAEAKLEIISPKGDKVATHTLHVADSIIFFSWTIPEEQTGGDYKFEISYPYDENYAFAQREFNIRVFRPPRLKTHLEFLKKGYGPGDTAQAKLNVERAEGGFPVGASVTAVARIDGSEAFRGSFNVDKDGNCMVDFKLPEDIHTGVGTLSCVIEDGGIVETASKTIPILLRSIDINVYPEGGDLVYGLENGIYIEAFTPVGDPADITADICAVDRQGGVQEVVGTISTDHEGRGRARFTPQSGEGYCLRVTRPTGIVNMVKLPAPKEEGVSLISPKKIYTHNEPVELILNSTDSSPKEVRLYKLDALIEKKEVTFDDTKSQKVVFEVNSAKTYHGVLRVTVCKENIPLAERLIFRMPKEQLQVKITPNKKSYIPGDSVKLKVETSIGGAPVSAMVGITVTDDAVRKMTEKRKQPPRLLAMALLEDEVDHLDDAHVYFKFTEKKKAKAENAIDLLLGTQGWRRFVYTKQESFLNENKKKGERLFVLHKAQPRPTPSPRFALPPPAPGGGGPPLLRSGAPPPRPMAFAAPVSRSSSSVAAPPAAPPPVQSAPPPPAGPPPPAPPPVEAAPPPPPPAARAAPVAAEEAIVPQRAMQAQAIEAKEKRSDVKKEIMSEREESKLPMMKKISAAPASKLRRVSDELISIVAFSRVYAHQVNPARNPTVRTDFTETLYWNAGVKTDPKGTAEIEFGLNDSVTSFIVMVDGVVLGKTVIGQGELIFESKQPFYIEPKLPLEVTSGDVIELPVVVVNNTEDQLQVARDTTIKGPVIVPRETSSTMTVGPDSRVRQLVTLDVGDGNEDVEVALGAHANALKDTVKRTTRVMPRGFPFQIYGASMIKPGDALPHTFEIPEGVIASSISAKGEVYASPTANMTSALKQLIREPCGCFEQTSSTVYPLTMAQKYFQSHKDVDPQLIKQADEILQKGYKRLTGFECSKGGYDWFGSDPASEPLSSYGILEFTEMSKVMAGVDQKMLQRTTDWLLSRRDGKGSWQINQRVLHVWSTDSTMADAYIVYSLTAAGVPKSKIEKEIESVKERVTQTEDPYMLALLANILHRVGDKEGYSDIAENLKHFQDDKTGEIKGAKTTVTHSGGLSLGIETTSLAILAWLKSDEYFHWAAKGAEYLFKNCQLGGYGNTQSTVLALEAIIDYDKVAAKPKAPGAIYVSVDGEVIQTIKLDDSMKGAVAINEFGETVSLPGAHTVELKMEDGGELNYTLEVSYNALLPASDEDCSVHIEKLALRTTEIAEGEGTEIEVTIKNKKEDEPLPMTMVIVGLPGGMDLRHEKMKELVKSEKIAAYELLGARRVACYFRHMLPKEEISFAIDVIAAVPGKYQGPASCAYLYYTNEFKHWVPALDVKITPRS